MPTMGAADRGDVPGMAGNCQPIVHSGSDSAPDERWVAAALMTGNQQDHSIVLRDRALQRPVDGLPGPVEAMAMEVEDAIGLDPAG